jgi:hypothetical protein
MFWAIPMMAPCKIRQELLVSSGFSHSRCDRRPIGYPPAYSTKPAPVIIFEEELKYFFFGENSSCLVRVVGVRSVASG